MPKILVIDDDPAMRRIMAHILEGHGHTVVLAVDGIDGVVKHAAELPDLTITDLIMPKQGGIETIIKIRNLSPEARITAVSGGGIVGDMHPLTVALRHGATEVIHKPFKVREFIDCVTRTLRDLLDHDTQELVG